MGLALLQLLVSTIHCCTVLWHNTLLHRVVSLRALLQLLVYGDERNTLLHRVGIFGEWRALLQLTVYGGEHNTLLHRVSLYRELRALLQAFSVWR